MASHGSPPEEWGFRTRAIHAGQPPDPSTGAVIVPIYATSTFAQEAPGRHKGFDYSRTGNPTRQALEEALAAVEGGRYGIAYASGMAAIASVVHLLGAGDEVVAGEDLYGGTYRLFERVYRRFGITVRYVDARDPERLRAAMGPRTRLVWVETPSNPLLGIVDLRAAAQIAHGAGALLAVDSTFASPYLQHPLELGADLVVHSTTKYIGGHSDVVGGAVVVNDPDLAERLHFDQNASGAVPGPFDAWLTLRGLKTLAVRMEAHEQSAREVARFLAGHPEVERVAYPGLPDHPQHELAGRQMRGYGAMLSFAVRPRPGETPRQAAERVLGKVRLFCLADSLGGVESLIGHPASMTHASLPEAERQRRGITDHLIRVSVGLEDVADLLADLRQALA
jgi:cystathionine gamma-lyase